MNPIIGITTYYVKAYEMEEDRQRGVKGQDMLMCTMDYPKSVEKAGGIPVLVPVIHNTNYIDSITEKIDGLILAGGPDVYPLLYDTSIRIGTKGIVTERDRFELELLDCVIKKGKPVFGICKGLHILNVYFGGTLYQDVYHETGTEIAHSGSRLPPFEPCHSVSFDKSSFLWKLFGEKIPVNSFHHQAVKKLGEGLLPIAWSHDDGMIEAVVHEKDKSIFGVQWHPEMMTEKNQEHLTLFQYFVELIKEKEVN